MFNTCNGITLATSNRQANSMLNNILIRVQSQNKTLQKQDREVRSLAASLTPFTNSKFSSEWIKQHQHVWQAHLERISDFLLCGPGVWWKDNGDHIEFLDGPDEEDFKVQGPSLQHFQSSNMMIETNLTDFWKKCVDSKVNMPIPHLGSITVVEVYLHYSSQTRPVQPRANKQLLDIWI